MTPQLSRFRSSLVLAFATAMLCVVVTGIVEYWGMVRLDHVAAGARRGDAALALAADGMREDVLELRRYEKDIFMNIGTQLRVQQYRAEWDRAFLRLRYDLVRARSAGATSQDAQLQQVIDWIAAYREAFDHIYDSISNGTIRTTREANDEMSRFKEPVRSAERALAGITGTARERAPTLDPAIVAQRFGLALSLVLFIALAGLFIACIRRLPSAGYA